MAVASETETKLDRDYAKPAVIGLTVVVAIAGLIYAGEQNAQAARAAFENKQNQEIAQESRTFCAKWGFSAGTEKQLSCVADLSVIRERQGKRIHDDINSP